MRNTIVLTAISLFLAGCLTEVAPSGIINETTGNSEIVNKTTDNAEPLVTGTVPLEVTAGDDYQFTPTASDPDGDALTFSISGLPQWASFDASTGKLSGKPKPGDVGTYSNISITVTDGTDSVSVGPFAIVVVADTTNSAASVADTTNSAVVVADTTNSAPSISGTAATQVTAGSDYGFTPTTNDADGDTLTFSISGLPKWASFDSSTGKLSGTPKSGDVGTYSNILITVTDGADSVSVGPFSIIVSDTKYGSVTLSWTAPTQNEDGSPLTDLDGYKLYWGKASGDYTDSTTINNESITTYVVENIPPGTYEFVATSFNSSGVESRYSSPATKVVP